MYTVKLTGRDPTVELMGPKKGNMIARNHIGITTGSLENALCLMHANGFLPYTVEWSARETKGYELH